MNIAQTPTESSVPEAYCFHLLILSGNKKRGAILQTTSDIFFPLAVAEGKKSPLRDEEKLSRTFCETSDPKKKL